MPRWVGSGRRRLDAVTNVMRQRDLRRLQLGWTAFFVVDAMAMVGLSVWAFDHGGASAVGVLGLARLFLIALWRRIAIRLFITLGFLDVAAELAGVGGDF